MAACSTVVGVALELAEDPEVDDDKLIVVLEVLKLELLGDDEDAVRL